MTSDPTTFHVPMTRRQLDALRVALSDDPLLTTQDRHELRALGRAYADAAAAYQQTRAIDRPKRSQS